MEAARRPRVAAAEHEEAWVRPPDPWQDRNVRAHLHGSQPLPGASLTGQRFNNVVARLAGFDGFPHADKLRLFAWALHLDGKEHVKVGDFAGCYDGLHLRPPSNLHVRSRHFASRATCSGQHKAIGFPSQYAIDTTPSTGCDRVRFSCTTCLKLFLRSSPLPRKRTASTKPSAAFPQKVGERPLSWRGTSRSITSAK